MGIIVRGRTNSKVSPLKGEGKERYIYIRYYSGLGSMYNTASNYCIQLKYLVEDCGQ